MLQVKPLVKTAEGHRIARNTSQCFLGARIQECYRKNKQLETDLYFQRRQLEYALSQDLFQHVEDHCLRQTQRESQKAKDTQIKKFDNLLKYNSDHRNNQPPPSQWVVNLSSKQLSQPQESVLAKGLNYALPPKQIPTSQIVASAEEALRKSQAPEETTSKARSQIIGVLKKAKPSKPNLSVPETKALRELRNDDSIMILPADKGRATVVMNKIDYDTKVKTMLANHSTYKPLAKDPTPSLGRQMNALLLSLRRSDHFTESQYNQLCCSAGQIPLLYALPKIHKPEIPLRPIVSFTSSPTYSLSKHLVSILSPLVGNTEHHVYNSLEFAKFIKKQTIEKNEVLVSFDVVSLFTKIPTDLAIQAAHKRLLDDTTLDQRTSLTPDEITSLLKLCLNATYFAFRDSFYQQVHRTAMGSRNGRCRTKSPLNLSQPTQVLEKIRS